MRKSNKRYHGAAVTACVTMLMFMAWLSMSVYSQMVATELAVRLYLQRQTQTLAVANEGLQHALSELRRAQISAHDTVVTKDGFNTEWKVSPLSQPNKLLLWRITATAVSRDGLLTRAVESTWRQFPLLAELPEAALSLNNALDSAVVVEYSLEQQPSKSILTSLTTAQQPAMQNHFLCAASDLAKQCQTAASALRVNQYPFRLQHRQLPNKLFDWVAPELSSATKLDDHAALIDNACTALNAQSVGLIRINGDCQLRIGQQVGSLNAPVILWITNGMLDMARQSHIFGLVVSERQPTQKLSITIKMRAEAYVTGAVIANHQPHPTNSNLRIWYRRDVLATLQQLPILQRFEKVAGSWKDF